MLRQISTYEPFEETGRCRWCFVPLDDHGAVCTRGCAVDHGGDAAAEKRGSTPRHLPHLDLLVMAVSVGTIIGAVARIIYVLAGG